MGHRHAAKAVAFLLVAMVLVGMATPAFAQDAGAKFWRGFVNAVTGWLEIPQTIYEESQAENPLYGLTVGTIKGAGLTLLRTASGVVEVATFPVPFPKEDYAPILEPEFVWSENGS